MNFRLLLLLASALPAIAFGQNGVGHIWPYFPDGPTVSKVTAIRFMFSVVQDTAVNEKILFSDERLFGPDADTYLVEHNLYSNELLYTDPVVTTWPLIGDDIQEEATMRLSIGDYNKKGFVGVKTGDAVNFPRQSYLIDGHGVPKTDMISQFNLNSGATGEVDVVRGDVVTDHSGWKWNGMPLARNVVFREWDMTFIFGGKSYPTRIAFPDRNSSFVVPGELLVFGSEFFKDAGNFQIELWNMQYQSLSTVGWQPLWKWVITDYDGDGSDWGFKKVDVNGHSVVEVSTGDGPYLSVDSVIDLSTP